MDVLNDVAIGPRQDHSWAGEYLSMTSVDSSVGLVARLTENIFSSCTSTLILKSFFNNHVICIMISSHNDCNPMQCFSPSSDGKSLR